MNYDYNGNLTFEERVAVITKELISYGLDKEMALKVASIEEPITTKDIYNFTFKRLSNILMLSDNKRINDKSLIFIFAPSFLKLFVKSKINYNGAMVA